MRNNTVSKAEGDKLRFMASQFHPRQGSSSANMSSGTRLTGPVMNDYGHLRPDDHGAVNETEPADPSRIRLKNYDEQKKPGGRIEDGLWGIAENG